MQVLSNPLTERSNSVLSHRNLASWKNLKGFNFFCRQLGLRFKIPDCVDFVSKQFDANWSFGTHCKYVNYAAAYNVFTRVFHLLHITVGNANHSFSKGFNVEHVSSFKGETV